MGCAEAATGPNVIEPVEHPPDEVAALLDDHEDDALPVDSMPIRQVLHAFDVQDDPTRPRVGIWSCY